MYKPRRAIDRDIDTVTHRTAVAVFCARDRLVVAGPVRAAKLVDDEVDQLAQACVLKARHWSLQVNPRQLPHIYPCQQMHHGRTGKAKSVRDLQFGHAQARPQVKDESPQADPETSPQSRPD